MINRKLASIMLSGLIVMALIVGGGTFALFTAKGENAGNKIVSAKLSLTTGEGDSPMYYTTVSHPDKVIPYAYEQVAGMNSVLERGYEDTGGWLPGTTIDRDMRIINDGTVPVKITGVYATINANNASLNVPGLLPSGYDPNYSGVTPLPLDPDLDEAYIEFIDKMMITITDNGTNTQLFTGPLRSLLNFKSGGNGAFLFNSNAFVMNVDDEKQIDFSATLALNTENIVQGKDFVFDFNFMGVQVPRTETPVQTTSNLFGSVIDADSELPIAGATVHITGIDTDNNVIDEYATTNSSGEYSKELPFGTYTASASAAGYDSSAPHTFALGATDHEENFALSKTVVPVLDGTLIVKVQDHTYSNNLWVAGDMIEDASIFIDGVFKGKTNEYGEFMMTLAPGSYTLKVVNSGYPEHNSSFNILSGQELTISVLWKKFYNIKGDVTELKNPSTKLAGVTMNFREGANKTSGPIAGTTSTGSGKKDKGKYNITLPGGTYTVELIKSGYETTYATVYSTNEHNNGSQDLTMKKSR